MGEVVRRAVAYRAVRDITAEMSTVAKNLADEAGVKAEREDIPELLVHESLLREMHQAREQRGDEMSTKRKLKKKRSRVIHPRRFSTIFAALTHAETLSHAGVPRVCIRIPCGSYSEKPKTKNEGEEVPR